MKVQIKSIRESKVTEDSEKDLEYYNKKYGTEFGARTKELVDQGMEELEAAKQAVREYTGLVTEDNNNKSVKESRADSDPIYHEMYEKYVPSMGKADTVLGEIIRAVSRIIYRWYNDGDRFTDDYGVETAGSSALYLRDHQPVQAISKIIASEGPSYDYDRFISHLDQALLDLLHNESEVEKLANQSNSINSVSDYYDDAKREFPQDDEDEDGWSW